MYVDTHAVVYVAGSGTYFSLERTSTDRGRLICVYD